MSNAAETYTPEAAVAGAQSAPEDMLSLRVLARLLDYPTAELQDAAGEMIEIIDAERRWPAARRRSLMDWCQRIAETDLLELQAEYVELFDKGKATSLLLFEHVHGESRDRGQAMVDLMNEYENAGFELNARELPDYLPMFLEYLSTRREAEIARWLGEIRHILALLGAEDEVAAHREAARTEERDDTPEALDAVWEEEAVSFTADSDQDCALQSAEGRRLAERKNTVPSDPVKIMPTGPSAG
ncbi:nitrate reductase molybdenum cofactor assembly chaperone [Halomonas piscis]|uniref:nitrate reductase molybdenum cofactor assembly chaperone n=1 Tax=Halomonas piscis TaxID=3031727 RepID=UPI002899B743|nr:nitrate reductase molybdenum cofactor assembly chaperone [Halomonas piscis]